MGTCRHLWGPMGIFENLWGPLGTYWDIWGPMRTYGSPWDVFGDFWGPMGASGGLWEPSVTYKVCGHLSGCMGTYGGLCGPMGTYCDCCSLCDRRLRQWTRSTTYTFRGSTTPPQPDDFIPWTPESVLSRGDFSMIICKPDQTRPLERIFINLNTPSSPHSRDFIDFEAH